MITNDFKIKLVDLGYALPLSGRYGTGFMDTMLGTQTYIPPEMRHMDEIGEPYQG